MSLETPEVRDLAEVLNIWFQVVCGEGNLWKGNRDIAGVLEETAFA